MNVNKSQIISTRKGSMILAFRPLSEKLKNITLRDLRASAVIQTILTSLRLDKKGDDVKLTDIYQAQIGNF